MTAGLLAGLSLSLHVFKFHEELGRAMAICPSPCSLVLWQLKFLAGMWKIPVHPQSDGEVRGWIKEREEQNT